MNLISNLYDTYNAFERGYKKPTRIIMSNLTYDDFIKQAPDIIKLLNLKLEIDNTAPHGNIYLKTEKNPPTLEDYSGEMLLDDAPERIVGMTIIDIINRWGVSDKEARRIKDYCKSLIEIK